MIASRRVGGPPGSRAFCSSVRSPPATRSSSSLVVASVRACLRPSTVLPCASATSASVYRRVADSRSSVRSRGRGRSRRPRGRRQYRPRGRRRGPEALLENHRGRRARARRASARAARRRRRARCLSASACSWSSAPPATGRRCGPRRPACRASLQGCPARRRGRSAASLTMASLSACGDDSVVGRDGRASARDRRDRGGHADHRAPRPAGGAPDLDRRSAVMAPMHTSRRLTAPQTRSQNRRSGVCARSGNAEVGVRSSSPCRSRVLIVEDEAAVREALRTCARARGLRRANSPPTARPACSPSGAGAPDAIVLDLMLPGRRRPRGRAAACAADGNRGADPDADGARRGRRPRRRARRGRRRLPREALRAGGAARAPARAPAPQRRRRRTCCAFADLSLDPGDARGAPRRAADRAHAHGVQPARAASCATRGRCCAAR